MMRTPRILKRILLWSGVAALIGLGGIVWERKAITRWFADAQLAGRRVEARYDIAGVGPRTQRLEHVVIGPAGAPDLTADWIELRLGLGWNGIGIRSLRAGGVRLHGRLAGNTISFGAVDRLLPKSTGAAFTLPDIDVSLRDARLSLDTGQGPVVIGLIGDGNLASGFVGRADLAMPQVSASGARFQALAARLRLATVDRRIEFSGPISVRDASIDRNAFHNLAMSVTGRVSESLTDWAGTWSGAADVGQLAYGSATRVTATGRFDARADEKRLESRIELTGARPGTTLQHQLETGMPGGRGTPLEPLVDRLRFAIRGLERGSVITLPVEYRSTAAQSLLMIGPPSLVANSGARLVGSGRGLVVPLGRAGQATFDGEFAVSGGDLPAGTVRANLSRGVWSGTARFRPYAANRAALALTPVAFRYDNGLRLTTQATLDGPLPGGSIHGLTIPFRLQPGPDPFAGCMTPRFLALDMGSLHLGPASFNACIRGNTMRIAAPRFAGQLGRSPLAFDARTATIGFRRADFALAGASIRLGVADSLSRLDAETLDGTIGNGGARGGFSGTAGIIGKVPLSMSRGLGGWKFGSGVLDVTGNMILADTAAEPRFNPLAFDAFVLRLAGNRISANGIAREPSTRLRVADVRIEHDLTRATGHATLDVRDLAFGQALQPEMLTTTTLGVIANVVGSIEGQGIIQWDGEHVTSTGGFHTDGLDLAAAFGPVTGLKGTIALSDLLGLESAPGQSVAIASINPGIAVLNGEVRYQLLPQHRLRIEGGHWPFAGGELILDPTTFDLSQAAERRLTFRVSGLDAGQFINQLQFENISATGVFDGELPMIFDEHGGRIEGGHLVARSGGTLAYVGEISNQQLGMMGRFAFDALKSIKYSRLTIDLAGPLDGDVVTQVRFAGVNQAPIEGIRAKLPIPVRVTGLSNFPFIFNVTITAPFRKLFDMSRTIADPSLLIERLNPHLQRIGPAKTIQAPESGPVQKGQ